MSCKTMLTTRLVALTVGLFAADAAFADEGGCSQSWNKGAFDKPLVTYVSGFAGLGAGAVEKIQGADGKDKHKSTGGNVFAGTRGIQNLRGLFGGAQWLNVHWHIDYTFHKGLANDAPESFGSFRGRANVLIGSSDPYEDEFRLILGESTRAIVNGEVVTTTYCPETSIYRKNGGFGGGVQYDTLTRRTAAALSWTEATETARNAARVLQDYYVLYYPGPSGFGVGAAGEWLESPSSGRSIGFEAELFYVKDSDDPTRGGGGIIAKVFIAFSKANPF